MKQYNINDVTEIAEAIKSGDRVENDIGTVIDGFFWFPEEMQWAAQWQKDEKQDAPYNYFAMLLDPDVFKITYGLAFLVITMPGIVLRIFCSMYSA